MTPTAKSIRSLTLVVFRMAFSFDDKNRKTLKHMIILTKNLLNDLYAFDQFLDEKERELEELDESFSSS